MAEAVGGEGFSVKSQIDGNDGAVAVSEIELARHRLRERWELASVLNFLNVFEPVIGMDFKISAEEIETGLIKPNTLLSNLHINLLKGIPPVSKTLNRSDVWVTALCKKLAMWWPWVAEGEIPLTVANGAEISIYKELDPTIRLLILKALCEIRADQDDLVSYINDRLKSGTHISCFRKDKIGGDENGTMFWYDGNAVTGHRLYREVKKFKSLRKSKNGECLPLQKICHYQWETLATNLEEFHKVSDEFSSSKDIMEVAVGKSIENDAIPVLEKLQKKKELALKRQQRREMLLNGFQNSCGTGFTRSCRNRRPVNYTYDEYDRAIKEAIQVTMKRKTGEVEQMDVGKDGEPKKGIQVAFNGGSDSDIHIGDSSVGKESSREGYSDNDKLEGGSNDDDSDDDYDDKWDSNNAGQSDASNSDASNSDKEYENSSNRRNASLHSSKQAAHLATRPKGMRWSRRLAAGIPSHPVMQNGNVGAKNRLRQRPIRNTALESIVLDSEDGDSSENISSRSVDHDSPSLGHDLEEINRNQ
ncbi:DDT domain-containing protein DDR4 [Malania oleifera]|uniref:DDT domain-containing protein DDR4 n=1 Tax=Malania oleifera TaxID=397392 RepID=UPI0025AE9CD3|nr:DDT domain-containing protein DDR4 [Malania oleifera]